MSITVTFKFKDARVKLAIFFDSLHPTSGHWHSDIWSPSLIVSLPMNSGEQSLTLSLPDISDSPGSAYLASVLCAPPRSADFGDHHWWSLHQTVSRGFFYTPYDKAGWEINTAPTLNYADHISGMGKSQLYLIEVISRLTSWSYTISKVLLSSTVANIGSSMLCHEPVMIDSDQKNISVMNSQQNCLHVCDMGYHSSAR